MINDTNYLFLCLSLMCIFFGDLSPQILGHFMIRVSFYLIDVSFLHILHTNIRSMISKYFHSVKYFIFLLVAVIKSRNLLDLLSSSTYQFLLLLFVKSCYDHEDLLLFSFRQWGSYKSCVYVYDLFWVHHCIKCPDSFWGMDIQLSPTIYCKEHLFYIEQTWQHCQKSISPKFKILV